MNKELQAEFDYIIIGTNFENSVLAGALSRIGKHVVLIDNNSYYGSNNATLCFSELHEFCKHTKSNPNLKFSDSYDASKIVELLNQPITKRTVIWDQEQFDIKEEEPVTPTPLTESDISIHPTKDMWNYPSICHWHETIYKEEADILKANRRYNIDIASAMLLSRGEIVDVLANSGLGQYCQFYPFNAITAMIYKDETPMLMRLPCSRQEIFCSKDITLKDKRYLTKFIQFVGDQAVKDEEEAKAINDIELKQGRSLSRPQNKTVLKVDVEKYNNLPFITFLEKEFHITGLLRDMIIYSICLAGSDSTVLTNSRALTTPEGLARVQEFISSLNIYGTTPFLYPIYGGGDVLQSFCRINNVYAGITMLQTNINSIILKKESNQVIGIEVNNDSVHTVLRCKHLITSDEYPWCETEETKPIRLQGKVMQGIYIFNGDNKMKVEEVEEEQVLGEGKKEEKDLREIIVIPATSEHRAIYLLVLNSEFKMTPSGEVIIESFMEVESEEDDTIEKQGIIMDKTVQDYISLLKSSVPIEMIYSCRFMNISYQCQNVPENYDYEPTCLESCYLYMDHRMERVKTLFEKLCPDSPFLPQTHSSHEAEKEDDVAQELSLFEQIAEKTEEV